MKNTLPDRAALKCRYEEEYETRVKIIKELESYLEEALYELRAHLTIKARIKSFESFYKKYLRYLRESGIKHGQLKIPDEIGVRVVCPFLEDIVAVEEVIKKKFNVLEIELKGAGYTFKEFGYEAHHLLVKIPASIGKKYRKKSGGDFTDDIAEIQVRTNLQDAWAEVEHELVYKAKFAPFDNTMRRKLAAINASLSLADTVFQEFRTYQKQLNCQLEKRRLDFYQKIEESMDTFIPKEDAGASKAKEKRREVNSNSIDDLLLNALYAHNKGLFKEAESFYSRILELRPDKKLEALVYKHRGMANFADSNYEKAIKDFVFTLELDETSHQAAYYLGVVNSCLREYSGAIDAFSKSIKINPFQKYCFFRRAQCYYHINDYPSALSDCEAALSLDCDFESAQKLKSILLNKLKM